MNYPEAFNKVSDVFFLIQNQRELLRTKEEVSTETELLKVASVQFMNLLNTLDKLETF